VLRRVLPAIGKNPRIAAAGEGSSVGNYISPLSLAVNDPRLVSKVGCNCKRRSCPNERKGEHETKRETVGTRRRDTTEAKRRIATEAETMVARRTGSKRQHSRP